MAQLMALPLTVSCFSKIQIGFTFLVPAHPGRPEQRAVKRVVCVCVCDTDPSSIARYQLGDEFAGTVAGHGWLRAQFYLAQPASLRTRVAVPRGAVAGLYARRGAPPSHARYDLFHRVDANKVVVPATATTTTSGGRRRRSDRDTTVRYLEWSLQ